MKHKWPFILIVLTLLGAESGKPELPALVISSSEEDYMAVAHGFRAAYKGQVQEIDLEGSEKKMRIVGEELKASPPPVTIVVGDMATQMAKWHLAGHPVIYCSAYRASEFQLPPDTTIGISQFSSISAQIEIIPVIFPERKNVGLFYSGALESLIDVDKLSKDADRLGVGLKLIPVDSVKEVPGRIESELPGLDLIWVLTDPVVFSKYSVEYIVMKGLGAKIPIFGGEAILAHGGATAALVPDLYDVGGKAAAEARKVLGEGSPSFGQVLFPEGSLVLNVRVAAILNVELTSEVQGRANTIIR